MRTPIRVLFVLLSLTVAACTRDPSRVSTRATVDPRETLAQCLADRGATLYSAHWCGYCRRQAELFGPAAFARVPHVECEPSSTRGQVDECLNMRIESYPTWVFANGSRNEGLMSLEELAAATGCPWTPP